MIKQRLDQALVQRKITSSRSQAESWIKLGKVTVDGRAVLKPGHFVSPNSDIKLMAETQYVGRAGLKLESVARVMEIDFTDKIVLDVGSSTGGFTDYALKNGASKVYAVDVGTGQMHTSLLTNDRIELYEKTDIRDVYSIAPKQALPASSVFINDVPEIILIDVSFISLREILPHIANYLSNSKTVIAAMVKPQFEAGRGQTNKGVIKNDAMRRQILRDFEDWARNYFVITNKRDSDIAGAKGNQERFYLLQLLRG